MGCTNDRRVGRHWVCLAFISCVPLVSLASPMGAGSIASLTVAQPTDTQMRAQRRLSLALAYFEQGQNEVALQEVSAALQIDAQHAGAYNLLGLIHQRDQAHALAQHSFEMSAYWAQKTDNTPALADAQHNLGWLLCQQARYDQAQALFQQALLQPRYRQHSKTWMVAGTCHVLAGQTGAARQSWQQSLALDPSNPLVRYQLALLDWQSDPASAQAMLLPIENMALHTPESLWLSVRVARALQSNEEMQRLGAQLLQRYPHSLQAKSWAEGKFEEQ